MREPIWIEKEEALVFHDLVLTEHGGSEGVRDLGLLESALARPKNVFYYSPGRASLARMSAAYACGIAGNHPFVDGNKRTALVVSFTFLELNGIEVTATQEETYLTFVALADGSVREEQLACWFERHRADAV